MPSFSAPSSSARIQESGVDALRGRFGHAVDRVGLLSAHSDLDNPRIVFDQFADGLAPKTPQLSQFADSVVLFEGGAIKRHRKKGPLLYKGMAEALRDDFFSSLMQ